jgi:hypothetical protein
VPFSTDAILADLRAEILRLQTIERALTAAPSNQKTTKGRISAHGKTVISLAAQLRHARRSNDRQRVKELTQKLKVAKAAAKSAKR